MAQGTCSVSGCDRNDRLKVGMCGKHYQRFKLYGSTDLPERVYVHCEGPQCTRRGGASGFCRSHYKQWYLGKTLTPLLVATKDLGRPEVCTVDGCGRPHKARGLCKPHNEHMVKHGTLRAVQDREPGRICQVEACVDPAAAKRLCRRHLSRVYLPQRYGITIAAYELLLSAQGGACAICGGVNANGYSLSVDHDHACCPGNRSCGKCVRGLLCSPCNFAIGHMNDDATRLRVAADYLERFLAASDEPDNDERDAQHRDDQAANRA